MWFSFYCVSAALGQEVWAWSCKSVTFVCFSEAVQDSRSRWSLDCGFALSLSPTLCLQKQQRFRWVGKNVSRRRNRNSRTPTHTHLVLIGPPSKSCEDKIPQCWIRQTVTLWTFQKLTFCRYILHKWLFGFWLPALHIRDLLEFACSKKNEAMLHTRAPYIHMQTLTVALFKNDYIMVFHV